MSSRQMTVLFIVLVSLFQVIREFRVGFWMLAAEFIALLLGDHRIAGVGSYLLGKGCGFRAFRLKVSDRTMGGQFLPGEDPLHGGGGSSLEIPVRCLHCRSCLERYYSREVQLLVRIRSQTESLLPAEYWDHVQRSLSPRLNSSQLNGNGFSVTQPDSTPQNPLAFMLFEFQHGPVWVPP